MKIIKNWKSRLGVIIGITGVWLIINCSDALIKHYQFAESFRDHVDSLVVSQLGVNPTQQDQDNRMILLELFSSKLSPEEYRQHNQLINRVVNSTFSHVNEMDRLDIQMLRLKMKPSFFLKHPRVYLYLGIGLLMFGLYYAEKHKPAPKPKPTSSEPTNAWESHPAPELKKNHQD